MGDRQIGVIINGATGRMGTTQHMANLLAIAAEGGLKLSNGDRLIPELLLVGRDAGRLARAGGRARQPALDHEPRRGVGRSGRRSSWIAAATGGRPERVRQAIAAGKHIHIEKPTAPTVDEAMELARTGRPRRREARRHPGQAVPARLRQAVVRQQVRLLRPHPVGEDRCRLVDLRRHRAGMPAAELELPEAPRAAAWRSI